MPRRATRCDDRRDQRSSPRQTCPLVGGTTPERTLTSVVLPEPLGPMTPTISPSPTPTLTSSSAWTPANVFVMDSVFSCMPRSPGAAGGDGGRLHAGRHRHVGAWSSLARDRLRDEALDEVELLLGRVGLQ